MSTNGKGDTNRPKTVDYKTWEKNYERVFKKKLITRKNPRND